MVYLLDYMMEDQRVAKALDLFDYTDTMRERKNQINTKIDGQSLQRRDLTETGIAAILLGCVLERVLCKQLIQKSHQTEFKNQNGNCCINCEWYASAYMYIGFGLFHIFFAFDRSV